MRTREQLDATWIAASKSSRMVACEGVEGVRSIQRNRGNGVGYVEIDVLPGHVAAGA